MKELIKKELKVTLVYKQYVSIKDSEVKISNYRLLGRVFSSLSKESSSNSHTVYLMFPKNNTQI